MEGDGQTLPVVNLGKGSDEGHDNYWEVHEIREQLAVQVLPALMQQLVKEGEVVRAPVALALVKLIRLLPERAECTFLPAVLQQVANVLKLRLQRIRYTPHYGSEKHH